MNWPDWFDSHPLLYAVVFLLVGPPMALSRVAARLPGWMGAAARHWRSRQPIQEGTVTRRELEDLQGEVTRLRDFRTKDLADAEVTRARDRDEIAGLRRELDQLREDFTAEKRIRWSAVG